MQPTFERSSKYEKVLFTFIGLVHQIAAIGVKREVGGQGFVEGTLPPFPVSIGMPFQSFGVDVCATKVEDADLLTWL